MKECQVCHTMCEDGVGRCTNCGRPFLFGQVKQKVCSKCGRGNPQYTDKCIYCQKPF